MSRDMREYARKTNIRLVVGAFVLLFVVGLGLIYFFYGPGGASLGFICILAGLSPVVLILLLFYATDWIMKHAGRQ